MRHVSPDLMFPGRAIWLSGFLVRFLVICAVLPAPTSQAASAGSAGMANASVSEKSSAVKAVSYQGKRRYYMRRGTDALVLAQADYEWSHDGKHYQLRSIMETVGVLAALKPTRTVQESRGELGRDGLRPTQFRHEKKNKIDTAVFDWVARSVSYRDKQTPLATGTQDLLSLYAQLAWRVPSQGSIDIPVATGSKVETYRISVSGEEVLMVNKRNLNAVRVFAQTEDERIDFWLEKMAANSQVAGAKSSPANFPAEMPLPLRIQVTEKSGLVYVQSLDAPVSAADDR